jgi:hypothetical protein
MLSRHDTHPQVSNFRRCGIGVVVALILGGGLFIPCMNQCECRKGFNLRHLVRKGEVLFFSSV